jgi:hypothetical protein
MSREFRNTDEFRDAYFWHVDVSGSVFRACDVNNVRIVGSDVTNLRINGHNGRAGRVIVDAVDVTAFVDSELDRLFPELVQMREIQTADDFRTTWTTVETLWRHTVARAQLLPPESLNERVDDEWSFIETLRHLVFATDVWLGRMLNGVEYPFHRLSLPSAGYQPEVAREMGIDIGAKPSLAEVLHAHADRRAQMEEALIDLEDSMLADSRTASPEPASGEETVTTYDCLFTVIEEHVQHRRYAVRDLAVLGRR